jgi:hypothetical protein
MPAAAIDCGAAASPPSGAAFFCDFSSSSLRRVSALRNCAAPLDKDSDAGAVATVVSRADAVACTPAPLAAAVSACRVEACLASKSSLLSAELKSRSRRATRVRVRPSTIASTTKQQNQIKSINAFRTACKTQRYREKTNQ